MSARALLGATALMLAASASAQDAPAIEQLADRFEYALVAGEARALPLTEDFRYTENGNELASWDGMWKTLVAVAGTDPVAFPPAAELDYRLQIVDGDEIVRLVETNENLVQGVMALRLKVDGGKIAEAEVLPIREEFGGERGGTVTLLQPVLPKTMDGEKVGPPDPLFLAPVAQPLGRAALARIADGYLDAVVRNSTAGIPIAADCLRRDNGQPVTGVADAPALDPARPQYRPYALGCSEQIDSGFYSNFLQARGRRHLVDPARGLVLTFVQLDQPGTVLSFEAPGVGTVTLPGPRGAQAGAGGGQQFEGRVLDNMITPLTVNGVFLFKIDGGEIRRIDAFYRGAPYGWQSGWEE